MQPRGFVPSYKPPRRVYESAALSDDSPVAKSQSAMELRQEAKDKHKQAGRAAADDLFTSNRIFRGIFCNFKVENCVQAKKLKNKSHQHFLSR